MHSKHQQLIKVKLNVLRPTQMTVGYVEVQAKKDSWQHLKQKDRKEFLETHWFPAVIGLKEHYYIVDHHHLGMALLQEDVKNVSLVVLKDFSQLEQEEFWLVMEHHQWLHPYDAHGRRRVFEDIPKKISALSDDPYRSLAAAARKAGAYFKESIPFAEFLWADFFRRRITLSLLQEQPSQALQQAMVLAHSRRAEHLPGWTGRSTHEF